MIEIKNLNKYFNKGKQNEIHVINDVSLTLPQKGMVAIFGKSGCGKTTLLNVIGGLDDYAGGSLTIEGAPMKNSDEMRNKYVGYIFQNYNLHAGLTCFENVANALKLCGLNDPDEIEKRVLAALKNVGMEKYKNRTPDTLSGGQQQRIAIARAIVKNPPVILADEPTGNLDEANTVMVMDLLKKIAQDHLVLIVTHEANLVDHYCDTVIELSDGKAISVRENENAVGLTARDKSAIYLGELSKTELTDETTEVEFYGELPHEPVKIQIVNQGGKLYLKVNTPKVQIVDETSEMKFKKGVFQAAPETAQNEKEIDMSELPPVEGKRFGRLFTFASAFKSGYNANFQKNKKGKKFLIAVMCLFAAVFVLITSVFGAGFGMIEQANEFNQNVFYVDKDFVDDYDELLSYQENADAAIDFVAISLDMLNFASEPSGMDYLHFPKGYFETYSGGFASADGVPMDESVCAELPVALGKNQGLADDEIVITTATADRMIKNVTESYINDYNDLIGLRSQEITIGFDYRTRVTVKIAGIVHSNEFAFYYSPAFFAKQILNGSVYVTRADDVGMTVPQGEAILTIYDAFADGYVPEILPLADTTPQAGETVQIRGMDFTVQSVVKHSENPENEEIFNSYNTYNYIVCKEDYVALSKRFGKSHATAADGYEDDDYLLLHSANRAKTEAFLKNEFGSRYDAAITDREDILDVNWEYVNEQLVVYTISLIATLAFLSVCMYFIMRSSLLTRIKEIGVYRAIGVSKKNLLFRFLVEAAVLTTLTVFVSYLVVSLGIFACFGISPLVAEFIYYPVWFALAVLIVLYGVCLVCGVLPIVSLLLKTPSQILAKYDI